MGCKTNDAAIEEMMHSLQASLRDRRWEVCSKLLTIPEFNARLTRGELRLPGVALQSCRMMFSSEPMAQTALKGLLQIQYRSATARGTSKSGPAIV
jgi:hypothetical protein